MFKRAYSNWSICSCAPSGLGSRPFIATGDARPASTMPVDDFSKQFRKELLNYHHLEGNIRMLNDVNFFCSFLNDSQTCIIQKAYKWALIFLKIILLSFPGQRALVNWCCVSFSSKRLLWWSLISFIHGIWTVSSSFNFSDSRQPFSRKKSLSKLVKFVVKCYYCTFQFFM